MNDPIGDMLTRIRNAQCAASPPFRPRRPSCAAWVLDVLADEGYIRGYENHRCQTVIPPLKSA